ARVWTSFGSRCYRAYVRGRRLAPIGRDQVMHIAGGRAPIPRRDHDVALDALRARRLVERQLAGRNPIRPLAPQLERMRAEPVHDVDHLRQGLAGLDAPLPRLGGVLELAQILRDRSGAFGAERVTRHAAGGLDVVHPLGLTLLFYGDAVALGAGTG